MWGILTFFILILALYLGFGWLADHPGSATFVWQGQSVEMSMILFLAVAAVAIIAAILVVWIVAKLFEAPGKVSSWSSGRRHDKGHRYLTRGILAAGAGNATLARQMLQKSRNRVSKDDEPILRFLDAQTALIEGDHDHASSLFRDMENDSDTKLLAYRGLYLEARRVDDGSAQEHYAERALRIAPSLPWAAEAVLERKSSSRDWDGARRVLEAQRATGLIEDKDAKRMEAIILTAHAKDLLASDAKKARNNARKAQKIAPDFVPAALMAAAAALKLNDPRRATRYIETTWVNAAHPELADAYVHARAGGTPNDRLRRAQKLKQLNEAHAESDMAVARAALDAGSLDLARSSALDAASKAPSESVYLLLADIEEEESGDVGRVREWLARAISAPRDPVWMADGVILEEWKPLSPKTHKLGAVEWRTPVEQTASGERVVFGRLDHGENARLVGSRRATGSNSPARTDLNGVAASASGPSSSPATAESVAHDKAGGPGKAEETIPSALLSIQAQSDDDSSLPARKS